MVPDIKQFVNSKGPFVRHRVFIIILLASIALRIIAFIAVAPWDKTVQDTRILKNDASLYHGIALEILKDHSFQGTQRTPGYPGFIAIIYEIFGERPAVVLAFQLLINTLTIVVLYVISEQIFSRRVALISAFLYAIDPLPVLYSLTMLSETVFTFVFLTAIASFTFGIMNNRKVLQLMTGFLFGISMLVRPVAQYFPILLIFIVLLYPKQRLLERIKTSILIILTTFLAISPLIARNYLHYNTFAITSQKGFNMLYWNAALLKSYQTHRPFEKVQKEFMQTMDNYCMSSGITDPFERSSLELTYAKDYIKKDLGTYTLIHIRGMINMFISPDTRQISNLFGIKSYGFPEGYVIASSFKEKVTAFFKYKPLFEIIMGLYIISLSMVVYLCTGAGFIVLFRRREWFIFILFLSTICYFTVLTGPIAYSRLKVPLIPIYTIVGAFGLSSVKTHLRKGWPGLNPIL